MAGESDIHRSILEALNLRVGQLYPEAERVSVSVNGGLSGALVIELDERFSVSSAHRGHLGSGDLRHWRRVIQPLHTRLAKVAPLHRPLV